MTQGDQIVLKDLHTHTQHRLMNGELIGSLSTIRLIFIEDKYTHVT